MSNKETLKDRITDMLAETTAGRSHSQRSIHRIADEILDLFRKRVNAPENRKKEVWAEGEAKILHELIRDEMKEAASAKMT